MYRHRSDEQWQRIIVEIGESQPRFLTHTHTHKCFLKLQTFSSFYDCHQFFLANSRKFVLEKQKFLLFPHIFFVKRTSLFLFEVTPFQAHVLSLGIWWIQYQKCISCVVSYHKASVFYRKECFFLINTTWVAKHHSALISCSLNNSLLFSTLLLWGRGNFE